LRRDSRGIDVPVERMARSFGSDYSVVAVVVVIDDPF
jgi:hypothetical protein